MLMLAPTTFVQKLVQSSATRYPSLTGLHKSISPGSLAGFLYALCIAVLLLVAAVGWGRLTGKLLRLGPMPASIACVTGIATIIALGGWINLAHLIYAGVLLAMVAIGLVLYIIFRRKVSGEYRWTRQWNGASLPVRIVIAIAFTLALLRVCATIRLATFDSFDDGPGYLTYPHKMLQAHSFAPDPFSERRVTTSVGGGYFLQSVAVSATSLANVAMADRTLGLILLGGILFDLGILFGLSISQIAWLELLAYLVPMELINLTFIILPISMLLGMVWMIWQSIGEKDSKPFRYALLAGVLGGAAISLKSTYLPCVGAFAAFPYLFLLGRRKAKLACWLPIFAGLGAFVVLVAWMYAMKQTSGTYLFPILGRGVDYSSYGLFQSAQKFPSTRRVIKIFLQGFALLILTAIQYLAAWPRGVTLAISEESPDRRAWFSISILVAAAIAITAINYASGGDSIWRYNFPQFFCAILIYFVVAASILRTRPESGIARTTFTFAVISLVGMIFYYDAAGKHPQPFRELATAWRDFGPSLRASLSGQDLENPQIRAEYRAIEKSLPAHAIALENTAYPFLFNYGRHQIFIADWPGGASPAPGWPFRSGSNSLAGYLANHAIRYVVYDYGYGRWTDVEGCAALEGNDLNSQWLKQQWWLSILSHNQFDHLRSHFDSVYDDGKIVVIDLARPVANAPAESPAWNFQTDKDEMCSAVLQNYLENPLPSAK